MHSPRSSRARLALTLVTVFAIIGVFAVRLVDIQVVRAGELTSASVENRARQLTTYGIRGEILDTNGVVLADSVDRFDITVSPRDVADIWRPTEKGSVKVTVEEALGEVAEIVGRSAPELSAVIADDPESNFAFLQKSVPLAVLKEVRALEIPWIYDQPRPSRTYPNGAVAGNLVGFVGTDGPQAGVELTADDCLASANGASTYERGADGVRIPGSTVTETQAQDGGTVRLTIDRDLQWFAQQALADDAVRLGADWATAVIVRVSDGHLMSVADYPTVDPNDVSAANPADLGSRAFSSPYEPGSTFKAMTVASMLDAGVITPGTEVVVPGRYDLPGSSYITDSWAHGDLRLTAAGVLVNSSNTGISLLSERLTAEERHDYMVKFGVGQETAVHFNGESAASFREAADWDDITSRTVGFGQGVSATSVQVAGIYQTLANGGVKMPLTLIEGCEWPDGTVTDTPAAEGERVVSEKAANQTVGIMEKLVTESWLGNTLRVPGYRVAVKTGTAEVAEGGRYTGDRVISVAGIAPADHPEYVVVVTFGKPDTMKTSSAAAPTFQKIMTHVLGKFRVEPSGEKAPSIPLTW